MASTQVAVAGATGNLGVPIVTAFLDAGFPVTALVRHGSTGVSKLPQNPNLTVKHVDFDSVPELTSALASHTVVVSTLASAAVGAQNPLIDAAAAAGVTRFIPSEFGSNTLNPRAATLPVFAYKIATTKHLQSVIATHPSLSYTLVINSAFLDWGLAVGFIVNPAAHSAVVYDGGDRKFSATTLATIAAAVVGIARNLDATSNRAVYVHDAVITQNQLIAIAKEKDGKEWSITHKSTEETAAESFKALETGKFDDIGHVMVGFLPKAIFGEGHGGDFTGRTDNELLGIKGLTEQELKELVWKFL